MPDDRYHLWRKYPHPPYRRFACTVTPEPTTPDGFRIVDLDTDVADHNWLARMAQAMASAHPSRSGTIHENGVTEEHVGYLHPGDEDHFEHAIRQVPDSVLRTQGRP